MCIVWQRIYRLCTALPLVAVLISILTHRALSLSLQQIFESSYHPRRVMRSDNQQEYEYTYDVPISTLTAANNPYATAWITDGDTTSVPGSVRFHVNIHLDNTVSAQQSAMFGILLIVLVIVVLVVFTASYSSVVNRLVVQPLEKMMTTLRTSAMLMVSCVFCVVWCIGCKFDVVVGPMS